MAVFGGDNEADYWSGQGAPVVTYERERDVSFMNVTRTRG